VKLHTKKLKTPKMIRRKLKTQELPNIKTKNPSKFTRKKVDSPFPPCETSHKKMKDPSNDEKENEDSRISKYQNKKPSKFIRRKLKTIELQNTKTKIFKVHKKKGK